MNDSQRIAITGVGYSVPPMIRTNNDPIFDWLKHNSPPNTDLFTGFKERRVLACSNTLTDLPMTLMDIMVPAARQALDSANLTVAEVDILLGYASVSEYITPNALAQLHAQLNLPSRTWIFPIHSEFTNFHESIVLTQALIQAGRGHNALIVCGCNWTKYVDYHTAQSISASDGAGAVVMGYASDASQFSLIDAETEVQSQGYGVMYMKGDRIPPTNHQQLYTKPFFHMEAGAHSAFLAFGAKAPAEIALRLLQRNDLSGADIALITHQPSQRLMDAWCEAIQPAQYLNSLETYANMTLAIYPVNLAHFYHQIEKDYLLIVGVGVELQTTGLLFKRNH